MKPRMPRGGTLPEWIEWFEATTGRPFRPEGKPLLYDPEHGFMTYGFYPETQGFVLWHVAGDGRYWEKKAEELGRRQNAKCLMLFTRRDPKAFARRYNAEVWGYWLKRDLKEVEDEQQS